MIRPELIKDWDGNTLYINRAGRRVVDETIEAWLELVGKTIPISEPQTA